MAGDFSLLIYFLSFTKNHPAALKKVAKIKVEIVCCLRHLKNESKTEIITDQYFLVAFIIVARGANLLKILFNS